MPDYDWVETEKRRVGALRYQQESVGPSRRDYELTRQNRDRNLAELQEILLRTPHQQEERLQIQQQLEHQQVNRLYTELPGIQRWPYGSSWSRIRSHASRSSAAGFLLTDYGKSRFARMNIDLPISKSLPELAPAKPMSESSTNRHGVSSSPVEFKLRTTENRKRLK